MRVTARSNIGFDGSRYYIAAFRVAIVSDKLLISKRLAYEALKSPFLDSSAGDDYERVFVFGLLDSDELVEYLIFGAPTLPYDLIRQQIPLSVGKPIR